MTKELTCACRMVPCVSKVWSRCNNTRWSNSVHTLSMVPNVPGKCSSPGQPNQVPQDLGTETVADNQMATTLCHSACCKSHVHDCAGCLTGSDPARCLGLLWFFVRLISWVWFTIADGSLAWALWRSLFLHQVDEEGKTTQSSPTLEKIGYVWLTAALLFSPVQALMSELKLFPALWKHVSARCWPQTKNVCPSCHRDVCPSCRRACA